MVHFFVEDVFVPILDLLLVVVHGQVRDTRPRARVLVHMVRRRCLGVLSPQRNFPPRVVPIDVRLPMGERLLMVGKYFDVAVPIYVDVEVYVAVARVVICSANGQRL